MNILVPIKQVPDLVEELEINEEGTHLNPDSLKFKINEYDEHALEEALQLKEETSATVTALAVDSEEADKLLFTAIAKGADRAIKITGDFAGASNRVIAKAMANVIAGQPWDLVLTGVQAVDDRDGQLGMLLAGYLNAPQVGVVTGVSVSGSAATVKKEYAGGVMAEFEVDLPAILGIQAARDIPRYVPVSKLRQVTKSATLEEVEAGDVAVEADSSVRRMMKPQRTSHAEMIEGDPEQIATAIVELLKSRGLKK